jgi:hypothetical protein
MFVPTIKFRDSFTTMLGKALKEVKTINVKIDFSKLSQENIRKQT